MSNLSVVVQIDDGYTVTWTLDRGPHHNDDAANERFLRAVARGLAADGYSVRLQRSTETREDVPL